MVLDTGRRMLVSVVVAFGALAVLAILAASGAAAATLVQTDKGPVQGVERSVKKYLGIPYAAPPVGDLRWRRPSPTRPGPLRSTRPSSPTTAPSPLPLRAPVRHARTVST